MKVAGFSFVRNAVKNDYPFLESIASVLPLCDKFFVVVGDGEDDTLKFLEDLQEPKLEIIRSHWDEQYYKDGSIYAVETNKAFDAIPDDYDWAIYIQSDECLHEKDYATIQKSMEQYREDKRVDCLVLKYLHFYASYEYVGNSRRWYRREIRIIKNDKSIRSFRDAQGFRRNEKKLSGKLIDAEVFHYGWVKKENKDFLSKLNTLTKYYRNEEHDFSNVQFTYDNVDRVKKFEGTHPTVIRNRIEKDAPLLHFSPNQVVNKMKWTHRILQCLEDITGIRLFEFKNHSLRR